MEKKLELIFKNAAGSKKTVLIAEPRENVTDAEAKVAMQTILDKNIFDSAGGDVAEIVEARYRTVDVEELQ